METCSACEQHSIPSEKLPHILDRLQLPPMAWKDVCLHIESATLAQPDVTGAPGHLDVVQGSIDKR
eukprot:746143-Hanusia_phi.AAC.7